MSPDPLERVLTGDAPAFALLHRPARQGQGTVDVLVGDITELSRLAEVPLSERPAVAGRARHEALVLVPYRQLSERGLAAVDDGTPLLALVVTDQAAVPLAEVAARIPDTPIRMSPGRFDLDDEAYAATVRRIVENEIGTGEGANFVIKRSYVAELEDFGPAGALTFFRRLVEQESGAYWTFVVHTGTRTLVGATPERHISVHGGQAVMNPVSGTFRYPRSGPTVPDVLRFLADVKEAEELYMVLDEELKTMARVCESGGRVVGPYLKEMARLAHTEYFIVGRSDRDPRDILRETLFAPTVTGSPVESAGRVISRYEPQGRGYYSGVAALIGWDEHGRRSLDSAILIRTADIDAAGRMRIGAGATLVRHSDPASEVAETEAKAGGLLAALRGGGPRLGDHPGVRSALERRNERLAAFWLAPHEERAARHPLLDGRRVLVVDAEDTFTAMIGHQLRSLGLEVTVRRFDQPYTSDGYDLVVLGPGPGDPRETGHPKIAHLRSAVRRLLDGRRPFLAVCLSHQVLSCVLGLEVVRRAEPDQGVQREIDFFGSKENVGFYNTFAARSAHDKADVSGVGVVEISRDPVTGEVHGLRGPHFASTQFHAESVLTRDGVRVVGTLLTELLGDGSPTPA
ncbi:anthranilate synthase family protein [Streptomyces sp.]|uniref:anthranilate synthase family protein n=1 Tax=Streptomyces sp. TaxID=1931 RepID=UPI002F3FDAB3